MKRKYFILIHAGTFKGDRWNDFKSVRECVEFILNWSECALRDKDSIMSPGTIYIKQGSKIVAAL